MRDCVYMTQLAKASHDILYGECVRRTFRSREGPQTGSQLNPEGLLLDAEMLVEELTLFIRVNINQEAVLLPFL